MDVHLFSVTVVSLFAQRQKTEVMEFKYKRRVRHKVAKIIDRVQGRNKSKI